MNLKALRLFRLTVLHGSLSAAAQSVSLSQPAASRLISALEGELKLTLFVRNHQKLSLTQEGERFYREAEHILNGVEEIPSIASEIRQRSVEALRIITSAPLGATLLPSVVGRLRASCQELNCKIDIGSRFDVERLVGSRRYNLGLLSLPVENAIVDLSVTPTLKARTQVLLPVDHPLAKQTYIPIEALAEMPFVTLRPKQIWRQRLDRLFETIGQRPRIALEVGSTQLVPSFVEAGFGLGLLDRACCGSNLNGKTVMRPLSPASELTYACILPPAGQRPIAQRFIEALRQDLEEKCEQEREFADNIHVLPPPEHFV
ncbi:LysR family transcriptional regulator [Vreelandella olivaria]|uniref:LysR family transcriptional regulator n=1 Tax=Vreelandella olivaria TaxID=390919 RepID=UPI00201E83D6|nr:LysR family transcriptional regulator [Halomonas olivaria]